MRQKICGEFASCLNYFVPTRDGILKIPVLSALPEKKKFSSPLLAHFFFFKLVITLAYPAGRKLRDFETNDEAFRFYLLPFSFSSPSETSTHSKRLSLRREHMRWREMALRREVHGYRFAMWLHLGNAWTLAPGLEFTVASFHIY